MTFAAQILTLYPEMFPGRWASRSPAGRLPTACGPARRSRSAISPTDRHKSVDDTPAGGGAGMVLRADVMAAAVDHAAERAPDLPILAMTPRGAPMTQARIRNLAAGPGVIILCGRFEGFDERLLRRARRSSRSAWAISCSRAEKSALYWRWTLAFGCFPA